MIASRLTLEHLAALLTWLLVSSGTLMLMVRQGTSDSSLIAISVLFLLFGGLSMNLPDELHSPVQKKRCMLQVGLCYLCVLGLFVLVPFPFVAIFLIILVAQIAFYIPIKTVLILSMLAMLPMWLIYQFYWQHGAAWISALLYWSFCLFAMLMVAAIQRETAARHAAEQANRELKATQLLLSDASRFSERHRIAQELHDVMGHHLTALSIHLQVAMRQSTGQLTPQLQQCYQLARLLLADIRQSVYDMNDNHGLDIDEAITKLVEGLPRLRVAWVNELKTGIDNVQQAEAILRITQEAISNALRHSAADQMQVVLSRADQQLRLHIQDNGETATPIMEGQGLTGMRRRIEALSGQFSYQRQADGFKIVISLPEGAA